MLYTLHGSVGSHHDWDFLKSQFVDLHNVDLWHYLKENELSLSALAHRINQIPRQEPSFILGYSMGGRITLHSLIQENSPWEKAVVISADTGIKTKELRELRAQQDRDIAESISTTTWDSFIKNWNQQPILKNVKLNGFYEKHLLENRKEEIKKSFLNWSTGQQKDLLPDILKIKTPTLWITGKLDEKFTNIAKIASKNPYINHQIIKDAGHRVPWEQPQVFIQLIKSFLRES